MPNSRETLVAAAAGIPPAASHSAYTLIGLVVAFAALFVGGGIYALLVRRKSGRDHDR